MQLSGVCFRRFDIFGPPAPPVAQVAVCALGEDFSLVKDFDGLALAARCLVRLCENGNLTVAAELIQAGPGPRAGEPPLSFSLCIYVLCTGVVGMVEREGSSRTACKSNSK